MLFSLGRHLLESTIFALFVGLLTFCWQKRGATGRHALWCIAAAKFALPMALFSALGANLHPVFPSARLSFSIPGGLSRLLPLEQAPAAATPGHSEMFNPLILIWLVGAGLMLAAWLPKLFARVCSFDSRGELDENSFNRLKLRVGLTRHVRLRFSDSQEDPVLSGFWKPVVILPRGISRSLSSAELEAVILHELVHAKRWDNWTGAFVHIVMHILVLSTPVLD